MLLVSGFALGALSIVFLIVARDFWRVPVSRVFLLLIVSGAFVLINPLVAEKWRWIGEDFMTAVPALFWLMCQMAFSYRPRLLSIWGAIALYSFIPPAFVRALDPEPGSLGMLLGWDYPRYAEYVLTLHGLWTVIANWSDDLVESRRILRGVVLGAVGSVVLVIIVGMNTGHVLVPVPILVSVVAVVCGFLLLRGRSGVLLGPTPVANEPDTVQPEEVEAEELPEQHIDSELAAFEKPLEALMAGGFYRTEKLTIKGLAEALSLPEYKTRALINQRLGYRNFNDYINQLRISEASQRLKAEPDTPILNISLDVGYRTLSSFNRAFKDQKGCSPSEYRSSASLESAG